MGRRVYAPSYITKVVETYTNKPENIQTTTADNEDEDVSNAEDKPAEAPDETTYWVSMRYNPTLRGAANVIQRIGEELHTPTSEIFEEFEWQRIRTCWRRRTCIGDILLRASKNVS